MKKNLMVSIVMIVLVAIVLAFVLTPEKKDITSTELLESVHLDITDYCLGLESEATTSNCPTCKQFSDFDKNFRLVENYSEQVNSKCNSKLPNPSTPLDREKESERLSNIPECVSMYANHLYKYEKQENGYELELMMETIYGRNTRIGSSILTFNFDKEGNLIAKDIPETKCLE